jgi:hypothetical protein
MHEREIFWVQTGAGRILHKHTGQVTEIQGKDNRLTVNPWTKKIFNHSCGSGIHSFALKTAFKGTISREFWSKYAHKNKKEKCHIYIKSYLREVKKIINIFMGSAQKIHNKLLVFVLMHQKHNTLYIKPLSKYVF